MKVSKKHFKQKILFSFFFYGNTFFNLKKLEIKKKINKNPKNLFLNKGTSSLNREKIVSRKVFFLTLKRSFYIHGFIFYLIFFLPLNFALAVHSSNNEFLNSSNDIELIKKKKIPQTVPLIVEKKMLNKQTVTDLAFVKKFMALLKEMDHHVSRPVKDALILLLATVFVVPLMRKFNTSPILGFLSAGLVLGPNGFGLIHRIGASKTLAEFGVVFFLFEMGLELSLSRLKSLGLDVFGLGSLQWLLTGIILALISVASHASIEAAVVIGFGIALSSSAFVLQLLSERGEVGTRFGRASFGILLFQDLAVVPLLVVVPLLAAGSGDFFSLLKALGTAATKAAIALGVIFLGGKTCLEPVFRFGASAKSPEAFVATILVTVLTMSTLTESLGLSDTLGAFLAGVLLAETKYRHQIEADIAPFRGLLLGLFFHHGRLWHRHIFNDW